MNTVLRGMNARSRSAMSDYGRQLEERAWCQLLRRSRCCPAIDRLINYTMAVVVCGVNIEFTDNAFRTKSTPDASTFHFDFGGRVRTKSGIRDLCFFLSLSLSLSLSLFVILAFSLSFTRVSRERCNFIRGVRSYKHATVCRPTASTARRIVLMSIFNSDRFIWRRYRQPR
jgi:hypothetical protein